MPETDAMVELIEDHDVMVPMRDGVRLRADVFRPSGGGPFPTLVQRYPYSPRDGFMAMFGRQIAQQGYAVVVQSCRGRYGSEGDFSPFHPDVDDSYDTVEWAAAQPWSNGRVGMYGVSYSGMSQWTAAISRPPHLVCLVPCLCTWDWADGGWYQNDGVMTLGLDVIWSAMMTSYEAERRGIESPLPAFAQVSQLMDEGALANLDALGELLDLQVNAAAPLLAHRPLRDVAELAELAPWFRDWCDHPDERDPYWRAISAKASAAEIDLPVQHVAGWYDYFLRPALDAYVTLKREAPTEAARAGQRLIVGPWNHNGGQSRPDAGMAGGFFFDFAPGSPTMNFFAHHLQDETAALDHAAPVRIFVMGANEWRDEHEWPLARTQWTPYHLRSGGRLTPAGPADEAPDTYDFNPADPVPGPVAVGPTFNDPVDLDAIADRADVLAYVTEPFESDVEVTGPVTVELWASSSAPSTDFVAKLIEVLADGTPVVLCQGVVRTAADGSQVAGAVYRHAIDLAATSVVVKAGHHLRLHIASSEYPTYELNPNTGDRITHSVDMAVATQHVFHDAPHPSRLVLPIIPA